MRQQSSIRNFCIIAHIDHGKSTLADRLMEYTGSISSHDLREQHLDSMALERERGITIKAQAVTLVHEVDGKQFLLNLIDTPGHVDFGYEVSRSLAACEGVLLLVDAAQGVQAQTVANAWLAVENGLDILPIINKIDLDAADPERVKTDLAETFGFSKDEVLLVSAKTGEGLSDLLDAIVENIPPPKGGADKPTRALIFDSRYDKYKGVIAYVRIVDGTLKTGEHIRLMSNGKETEIITLGFFSPDPVDTEQLGTGEVGFVATGLKNVADVKVGDTITAAANSALEPLRGYSERKPMVFAGLYPAGENDYSDLKDALSKLQLNDAAIGFEPESSAALGFGFRCGFLGTLHMEVVRERLEREYGLNVITTAPSVEYEILLQDGKVESVGNPSKLPDTGQIAEMREPWVKGTILTPSRYVGPVIELLTSRRGEFSGMEYLASHGTEGKVFDTRVSIEFNAPLGELLADFYDTLKSVTSGYASLDYKVTGMRAGDLVKLDIWVNHETVDALSMVTHKSAAQFKGRELIKRLRKLIPRHMFEVPLQAAIGGRVIARENIKAMRKNVLAKCYGGDVTRKRKLLEKQAEGKKRMKMVGRVEVPEEAFMSVLRLDNKR